MTDYPISTTLTLYVVIREESGEQAAPADLALRVTDPSGTTSEVEWVQTEQADLAKAADAMDETLTGTTGVYQAQVTPDVPGTWYTHWQASSPTAAIYSWFQVPWPLVPVGDS